jgi:predicted Zn-dependent peptidase
MESTRLPNGVRVVSEQLSDLPSTTVGVWVENGSRYERPDQAGISHFLEHLFFKGTKRRSAAEIAQEIDAVGGVLNAFTDREYTCYYAKVLRQHLPVALDLLADIFTESQFAAEEIDRERSVIVQEISQIEDTPDEHVHELFRLAFWRDHPLSRPIAGTVETVSRLGREDFLNFLDARYRADRVLIAAAGNVVHEDLVRVAARTFGDLRGAAVAGDGGAPQPRAGLWVHEKDLEQVHLCLGTPGISQTDADRYAAHLVNVALGGGMSSRLFQEVRERRGRAYSVYSFLPSYLDAGYVGVYVGTAAEWVREVIDVVRAEIGRIVGEGLRSEELRRVKNQMKGSLLLGLETSGSRMTRLAVNEIYFRRDVPLGEIDAGIDAVGPDDIVRVAARLFPPDALALTVLGDLKGERLDDEVLRG